MNSYLQVLVVVIVVTFLCAIKIFGAVIPDISENEISNDTFQDIKRAIFDISDNEILPNKTKINSAKLFRLAYAAKMKSYMNKSVEPCDDFYEYACGNWKNVIDDHKATHKRSNLLDISYILIDNIEKLLQIQLTESDRQENSTDNNNNYSSELEVAKHFFKSCMSAELYPTRKVDEYLDVVQSVGGFPAIDSEWNAENFSWFKMNAHLAQFGAEVLAKEKIIPQYPFPPYFDLPDLGFDYLVNSDSIANKTSNGYLFNEKKMHNYLTAYGVERTKASQVIEEIFDLWRDILKDGQRFFNNSTACANMDAEYGAKFASWNQYFEIAWQKSDFNITEISECPCNYFYVKLDKIAAKRKTAMANYLALKFLHYMDAKLEKPSYHSQYCVTRVTDSMPFLLSHLYLKEYFSDDIRQEVAEIVEELRKSLRHLLNTSDWLDESTKKEALLKEKTLIARIGLVEDPLMDRLIREVNNLTLAAADSFAVNNLKIAKFRTYMTRFYHLHEDEINENTKPTEILNAAQVNAFYYNLDNSINIMAGILHPPVYHRSFPNSVKYGTLGYLLGHELTHGFDSTGAMYDSIAEHRHWWSNESGKVFDERSSCFVKHFNAYIVPEIKRNINGKTTKDENIADSGGLREAFASYRNVIKRLSKMSGDYLRTETMPGLEDMTNEQIFFLSFAQLFCAWYKEEHFWEELTDDHAMDKYRVLGALKNFEEFSFTFNCPLGSQMNPRKKCRVW